MKSFSSFSFAALVVFLSSLIIATTAAPTPLGCFGCFAEGSSSGSKGKTLEKSRSERAREGEERYKASLARAALPRASRLTRESVKAMEQAGRLHQDTLRIATNMLNKGLKPMNVIREVAGHGNMSKNDVAILYETYMKAVQTSEKHFDELSALSTELGEMETTLKDGHRFEASLPVASTKAQLDQLLADRSQHPHDTLSRFSEIELSGGNRSRKVEEAKQLLKDQREAIDYAVEN